MAIGLETFEGCTIATCLQRGPLHQHLEQIIWHCSCLGMHVRTFGMSVSVRLSGIPKTLYLDTQTL